MKITKKVGVVLGVGALAVSALSFTQISKLYGTKIIDVIDGDTIVTENKQRVRLFGVNSPDEGYCYAQESKEKLVSLVKGKRVVMKNPIVDKYGRIVAVLYVKDKMINAEMVRGGFGRYDSEVNSDSNVLREAREEAMSENRGLYGECVEKEALDSRCVIKGNQDYGPKIYHLPGCFDYERTFIDLDLGDEWFCSENDAEKAGFVKSKNCK